MNLTEKESHECAKLIYYHFGQNMAELAMIKTMLKKKNFSCPKLPNQDSKKVIFMSQHILVIGKSLAYHHINQVKKLHASIDI